MNLEKTHIIVMIGGVLTVVSAFLAWSTHLNLIDASELLDTIGNDFINSISTFLMGVIIVFGIFTILEPLLDAYSENAYKGKFGIWMIFNGIVIVVASALIVYRLADYGFGVGAGGILAIVGGIVAIVGGAMAQKSL